jgi:dUTP pyrophosphatase
MNQLQINFKKLHPSATIPKRANATDAGFDLVAISAKWSEDGTYLEYCTGLAIEIPFGHVGYIFQRSSVSNVQQYLSNAVGVIDSGYRGEIRFRFRDCKEVLKRYKVGDKIGQLIIMPIPQIEFVEVDELSSSDRGECGFGSSGK